MSQPASSSSSETGSRSNRFPRSHRLRHQRLIRPLFDRSRSDVRTVAAGCVRLLYRAVARSEAGLAVPLQIGFAPGRTRTAVARNRIRRLLREVYRIHQSVLVDLFARRDDVLTVMVLFRGRPEQAAQCIPRDLPEALRRLAAQVQHAARAS